MVKPASSCLQVCFHSNALSHVKRKLLKKFMTTSLRGTPANVGHSTHFYLHLNVLIRRHDLLAANGKWTA